MLTEPASLPGTDSVYSVWSVPCDTTHAPAPEWLLQLATLCAVRRVNETSQCIDAPEALAQLDEIHRQLDALPADAPYVEWGRWLLDNRPTRPIAPGFSITPAEADALRRTREADVSPLRRK